jgi:hypothetical protein
MSLVPLLGYAPDADPTIAGVLTGCSAAVPSLRGMKGAPSAATTPLTALAGTCIGSYVSFELDDTTRFFAGTTSKLYEANVSAWSDVSRAAAYTATSTQRWRFATYGNVSLASNPNDTIQASVSSGAFSCISGAPKAAIIESVNSFILAFSTNDSVFGSSPDRWWSSALGDYTSWTPSIATQAASGRLTSTSGPITAGRRFGDAIIAYKRRSMYLGVYTGPPFIWSFTQIPGEVGALSQEAVVNIGTPENPKHVFMGEDNFYVYDGSKPVPIGTNRVKNTVFGQLLQSRYYACMALHDRQNAVVYFYYPVADSQLPDHCVAYNYRTDRWGQDDRQVEAVVDYVAPAVTYGALGGTYNTYNDFPALPYGIVFLSNSTRLPGIFDTSHTPRTLTGAAVSSSITTGDMGDDEMVTAISRVRMRFITKPSAATMTNYYKMNEGDALTSDAATQMSSAGAFDVLRDARWHRAQFSFTGDWESPGFTPTVRQAGSE